MSQIAREDTHEAQSDKKDTLDEEMIDVESIMEKEKEEMKMTDQKFKEKTKRLSRMIGIQQGEASVARAETDKESKYMEVEKQSSRVIDRGAKIMDKSQARKTKENEPGMSKNPSSILSNFHSSHFVNVAQSCGIKMGNDEASLIEVIKTLEAQEQAHAMLNDARIRRERELQLEKEKKQQLVNIEGDTGVPNEECENDEIDETSSEESSEGVPKQPRVVVHKRRHGRGQDSKKS
jgi:hypothetical protein